MKLSQLIVLLVSVFSLSVLSGCTSSQTDGDEASAEVTDESMEMAEAIDDNSDLSLDLDGGEDAFADFDSGSSGSDVGGLDESAPSDLAFSDDTVPPLGADDLSEVPLAESAPMEAPLEDLAPDFTTEPDPNAFADNSTESEPDFGAPVESAEVDYGGEATPEPTFSEPDTFASTSEEDSGSTTDTFSSGSGTTTVSLKKMISTPYKHNGNPVNALYMAREGDTLQSISQKIFGGDRVSELCSINAYNCSREIRVGDKYYYTSPQRPNDMETVKTFYEDAGIPAQTYLAQEGDNIRDLGSSLLGNRRSWMELWATNENVESKGELSAGTTLRYWPTTSASLPTLAQNEPPAPEVPVVEEPMAPPPEEMAMNDLPEMPEEVPPMEDDFAQNDAGFNDSAAMGSIEPPPPPPPPAPPINNTPPERMDTASNDQFEDPNQTMALGVGAIILLLAGVILFIAIRKRRARRPVDFNTTTHTQIE